MEIKDKVQEIFQENNWDKRLIDHVSAEFDQNGKFKAMINYDKEELILKHVWVREDFRGTGFTQDFLRLVFEKHIFMFVWEPNEGFIKAMVKAGLGLHLKIQRMDVWCLIPQMLSDSSIGFISRHDYLVKKNKHYYNLGTGPDKKTIVVTPLIKDLNKITKEEAELISKDKNIITKKWSLIWKRCNNRMSILVQEFSKDWTDDQKIAYQTKLENSKSFLDNFFEHSLKQYEQMKEDMDCLENK